MKFQGCTALSRPEPLLCVSWRRGEPATGAVVISGALGENSPLPLVLWEEGSFPSQGQKTLQVPAISAGWSGATPETGLCDTGSFKTLGFESQPSAYKALETVEQDKLAAQDTL